jgi:hypothetical protein
MQRNAFEQCYGARETTSRPSHRPPFQRACDAAFIYDQSEPPRLRRLQGPPHVEGQADQHALRCVLRAHRDQSEMSEQAVSPRFGVAIGEGADNERPHRTARLFTTPQFLLRAVNISHTLRSINYGVGDATAGLAYTSKTCRPSKQDTRTSVTAEPCFGASLQTRGPRPHQRRQEHEKRGVMTQSARSSLPVRWRRGVLAAGL